MFFPSGWCFFYLVITGWIFTSAYVRTQSINQSVWGYLDGRFDYGASGVCTRCMRRYGSVWWVYNVCRLDEPTAGTTPVCHDCLVVNGTSKLIINIPSRHGTTILYRINYTGIQYAVFISH